MTWLIGMSVGAFALLVLVLGVSAAIIDTDPPPASALGDCEECGGFGVDTDYAGADGRSVCDDCRDAREEEA
jgi:hypothetical protein